MRGDPWKMGSEQIHQLGCDDFVQWVVGQASRQFPGPMGVVRVGDRRGCGQVHELPSEAAGGVVVAASVQLGDSLDDGVNSMCRSDFPEVMRWFVAVAVRWLRCLLRHRSRDVNARCGGGAQLGWIVARAALRWLGP
ncbi:hypothetical protein [Nocardia terpenica]|uniref:Uncharacterized protein n=1 Tax=Nocardia terpenica TaxID=455432 RepID=A0A291RR62_9NOCA|nr:hypothetical protein [Nocardia terpenica]ATL69963.1 hypothetical protein CRH09_31065 [Nocardia terpenica]